MTARAEQIQFLVRAIPYLFVGFILTLSFETPLSAAPLLPPIQEEAAAEIETTQDEGTTESETPAEPTIEASDGDSDAESNESPTAADTDAVVENGDGGGQDKEEPGLEAKIDEWFGKYITGPCASVLFNSLGTEYLFGRKIPFVVLWLLVGASFLTIRMGFINLRAFWHAIRLTKGDYDDPNEPGEVSHFQALSSALSATVGLGNIAGVAIAVGSGGPGAIFWMVLIGLLGMTSKFTECTLGQMYRKVNSDGTVSGGPMLYLKDGLTDVLGGVGKALGSVLAVFFALLCIGGSFGGGNSFQVGQSLATIKGDIPILEDYPLLYGVGLTVVVALVIIGGIRSIGRVASIIVPFMCAAYVSMALYILGTNASQIPAAFGTIISNAFTFEAGLGGLLGVMVVGIQRAVFSNEAGAGSAAIAHSAAKTDEPVSEGIVALLEPFIDTVLVCTMTGLVIIIAGGEWTPNPELTTKVGDTIMIDGEAKVAEADDIAGLPLGKWSNQEYEKHVSGNAGAALTRTAVANKGLPWFKWILYAAVVLFAFSTIISWSYYGERCFTSLFGMNSSIIYKVIFLVFTVLGSVVSAKNILDFSDIMILGMSLPNILGLYILSGKVRGNLDEYMEKLKSGKIKPHK
ncbi:MAG: alanine/glycine:cation symporter family protein [Planctomycetota bacterium]|nr:alanine:cation symporter family protein [Pirellulaceae bacterium]MEC7979554.1 alanine/glycine:cation symporter family protein [Planctomycetota bacterium]MEC8343727.1 alanine/glycine:cation symporter family protein [Planctomycetota bacterium]MEC8570718.1 alanine/glycine:cation symporter family protein [Planctomycetota bacterium]MEC8799986.1 alanine/glycine:cation symporter family protein [Planctomycetota bacterium]